MGFGIVMQFRPASLQYTWVSDMVVNNDWSMEVAASFVERL